MTSKRKPLRWRRRQQKYSERGNAMTNFVWRRDFGHDQELVQSGVVLATVKPDGRWSAQVGKAAQTGRAASMDDAKNEARAWVVSQLAEHEQQRQAKVTAATLGRAAGLPNNEDKGQ